MELSPCVLPFTHTCICFISVTFRDATNQAVACRLVKEVRGLNPTFDAADIRGKFTNGAAFSRVFIEH